ALANFSSASLGMNTVKFLSSWKSASELRKRAALPPVDLTSISTVTFSLTFLAASAGLSGLSSAAGTSTRASRTPGRRIGGPPRVGGEVLAKTDYPRGPRKGKRIVREGEGDPPAG